MTLPRKHETAKSRLAQATAFVSLIGRLSETTTAQHVGTVHTIEIVTTIHYQPYDGAKNYHKCPAFDDALAAVIREDFAALSKKAIVRLQHARANAARDSLEDLRALEKQVRAAIAEIDGGQP